MTVYHIGDTVRLQCTFTNAASVNTDPAAVALTVQDPSGTDTAYTYAGATITRSAAGVYYVDVTIDEAGTWEFRWVGTGTVTQADQGSFYVVAQNT